MEQRVAERTAELEDKQRELALTNERLEALATTDHLTGLCNRRRFRELIEAELKTAQRHGRGFALIMFDLDRFKPVNDNYGHHAGDAVLQRVAQRCAQCLRETDRLARYGGEEFMALITEASEEAAAAVAERMPQRLAETSVDCARSARPMPTSRRCCAAPTRRSMPPRKPGVTAWWSPHHDGFACRPPSPLL
ncbi:MAG: hypothetical protein BRD57_01350 [Proteobacteria bacterium SW_6_67_9]|nr:MAG: hypothetical protein BRD57_01350 [Proteobacteria bacterium SW_6_67_9]